ncbi:MAG: T9SS type A sorting domain-containing protein [Flavobacteriales bacterium]
MDRRKISVTICSSVIICSGLSGQGYIPLLDTAATWQDENGWINPGPNTSSYECRRFYLGGDSLVEGIAYRILRSSDLNNTPWILGSYTALLREDTIERRVYIRPPGWSVERLFYDFSVGVGPYPDTYRFRQTPGLMVTAVDTIWLTDGPHRRLRFGPDHAVIEGIGCTRGFWGSAMGGEIHWMEQLVCHTLDATPVYIVPSLDCDCGLNLHVPANGSSNVRIGPSPTKDMCRVSDATPNSPYILRSIYGRVMRSGTCSSGGSATIDMTELPTALYLLELVDKDGSLNFKILKE